MSRLVGYVVVVGGVGSMLQYNKYSSAMSRSVEILLIRSTISNTVSRSVRWGILVVVSYSLVEGRYNVCRVRGDLLLCIDRLC